LQELFRKAKQAVARLVEAHDLHSEILTAFKRLAELVTEGGGLLVVILVGHPKLRNDLKRHRWKENRRPDDGVRVRGACARYKSTSTRLLAGEGRGRFGSCEASLDVPAMKCVRNEPGAFLTQSRRIPFRPRHTRSS
jgi:hypothetical protein